MLWLIRSFLGRIWRGERGLLVATIVVLVAFVLVAGEFYR